MIEHMKMKDLAFFIFFINDANFMPLKACWLYVACILICEQETHPSKLNSSSHFEFSKYYFVKVNIWVDLT